ncbi:hypothetical protein Pelo_4474 [Pelomyxa schiedti]|nr:hypothetical protein Pelo_4474 [Pelomyxa schiedti]
MDKTAPTTTSSAITTTSQTQSSSATTAWPQTGIKWHDLQIVLHSNDRAFVVEPTFVYEGEQADESGAVAVIQLDQEGFLKGVQISPDVKCYNWEYEQQHTLLHVHGDFQSKTEWQGFFQQSMTSACATLLIDFAKKNSEIRSLLENCNVSGLSSFAPVPFCEKPQLPSINRPQAQQPTAPSQQYSIPPPPPPPPFIPKPSPATQTHTPHANLHLAPSPPLIRALSSPPTPPLATNSEGISGRTCSSPISPHTPQQLQNFGIAVPLTPLFRTPTPTTSSSTTTPFETPLKTPPRSNHHTTTATQQTT